MQPGKKVKFGRVDLEVTAFSFGTAPCNLSPLNRRCSPLLPAPVRSSNSKKNLAWFDHPIPVAFWADVKAKGLLRDDAPTP